MKEDLNFECVAENGVGDPVSAKAKLEVLQGKLNAKKLGHFKNEIGENLAELLIIRAI